MKFQHFKQTDRSRGCGVYAVANALADQCILRAKGRDCMDSIHSMAVLTRYLDLCLEPQYVNESGVEPRMLCPYFHNICSPEENKVVPMLLIVKEHETDTKQHMVAGLLDWRWGLTLMDSLKDDPVYTSIRELKGYEVLYGIYFFHDMRTGELLLRDRSHYF